MSIAAFDAFASRSRLALCAGLLFSLASTAALADERCDQLVALNRQYAGVALNAEQQNLKRKLVAWYNANCGRTQRSALR